MPEKIWEWERGSLEVFPALWPSCDCILASFPLVWRLRRDADARGGEKKGGAWVGNGRWVRTMALSPSTSSLLPPEGNVSAVFRSLPASWPHPPHFWANRLSSWGQLLHYDYICVRLQNCPKPQLLWVMGLHIFIALKGLIAIYFGIYKALCYVFSGSDHLESSQLPLTTWKLCLSPFVRWEKWGTKKQACGLFTQPPCMELTGKVAIPTPSLASLQTGWEGAGVVCGEQESKIPLGMKEGWARE